ncbi:MAG TPA: aa3-type cytochrome c oxidase subunit IV [Vineibacter sp.]|nr:aa3-type cytochrome c oxidase subunit IV [Vineibacter sp.]
MADSDFDMRQHRETYSNVMKLTAYTILAILIIVIGLAFGLVGSAGWTALIAMFLGLLVLTIVAAVTG